MTDQTDYQKLYIQESDELLQEMNKHLLILEKEVNSVESLNAIFRAAHTLKSMSASMGYHKIADLSHKMEDVLSLIRNNKLKIKEDIVNCIFKSFDLLEKMVGEVQEGKEIIEDIQPILEELIKFQEIKPETNEKKVSEDLNFNEFEKRTLVRVKKDGYSCFKLKVILEKTCVLKSVRAFMVFRNLHEIGEVIKSVPDSEKIEEEKFDDFFICVIVTKVKPDIVEKKVMEILEIEKVAVNEILIDDSWYNLKEETETQKTYQPVFEKKAETPVPEKNQSILFSQNLDVPRKIQTIRVGIDRLDKLMNLVEELAISRLRLQEVSSRISDPELKSLVEVIGKHTEDIQTEVMNTRLIPLGQVFDRFPRFVRDLAKKSEKKIKFEIIGSDVELDRSVVDEIGDPLIHLLKNAIDHGIELPDERLSKNKPEEGKLTLLARRERSHVFIEVEDDGKGMDIDRIKNAAIERGIATRESLKFMSEQEILLLTALPGLSTKKEVTEVSGRGVGLDVVKQKTESLNGSILIESKFGIGSKISMRLPLTTAVIKALIVNITDSIFAIPISSIIEIIKVKGNDIKTIESKEAVFYREKVLPIFRIDKIFDYKINTNDKEKIKNEAIDIYEREKEIRIVVVESVSKQFGIIVDKLINQQDIVIKQLNKELKKVKGFTGATILGDGKVVLVLDVATLLY